MAAPKTTTWPLEPHTRAKHEILRRYLHAWAAILGSGRFPMILYVDGFAGPGRYSTGEDGSPVIALNAALAHANRLTSEVRFQFMERNPERAEMLRQVVSGMQLPDNFGVRVTSGSFESDMNEILAWCRGRGQALPPTFAFIDPFGWTGIPFDLIRKILANRSCEVLVNFMYEEINRFLGHPDQERNLDQLFGTPDWRELVLLKGKAERRLAIHSLYQKQLGSAARYVRSFEMRNDKDVTDYFLFFATNNVTGLRKMKEAMWGVDQSGEFTFSDATDPKQLLMFGKPDLGVLRRHIVAKFGGRETTVGTVENFVVEETAFRETHYKGVLKELELGVPTQLVPVNAPGKRKRGTFADKRMRIKFM